MTAPSRLARLLCRIGAVQGVAALAWAWAFAPRAPWIAGVGAALILFLAPVVLGIEFVLLARVAKADGRVVAPSAADLLRAWAAETAQLFRVFYWRQPLRWRGRDNDG